MVIKVDSLSFTSMINSLTNYFDSQAESQKWKDFYESSIGKLFIRLLSAFGAFISYIVTVARRENYITYAQNRTSLIGIAQNLGYSTSRGKNEIIDMVVIPNMTGTLPAYSTVGTVGSLDLVTVGEVQLNKNISSMIRVYLGNVKSEDVIVDTDKLKVFRFNSSNVSDYIRLKLNDVEVPLSNRMRDLANDKYVTLSNPLGAVDVQYLQEGSFPYSSTDTLTLDYIELAQATYNVEDLNFDFGVITSISKVLPYTEPETNDGVRINASLYHETQVLIRGREDYLKEFKSLGYSLANTNARDFTPAIVDLSYVKNDYTIMSNTEQTDVLNNLETMRAMGVPLPRIEHPKHMKLALSFDIKKNSMVTTELTDVESDIKSITINSAKILNPVIDLDSLEYNTDNLSYTKRSRVNILTTTRVNDTKYRLGDFITTNIPNSKIYMAYDFIALSGDNEPVWSYTTGDTIADNGLVWRCLPRYGLNPAKWVPERFYRVGDLVLSTTSAPTTGDFMFECVYIQKSSGTTKPSFTPVIGQFTEDEGLIWVCKYKVTADSPWQGSHTYHLGDSVLEGDFSYECIGFKGTTDSSEPVFKEETHYSLIGVDTLNKQFTILGDKHSQFLRNDTVRVLDSLNNDGYYTVVSSAYNGSSTIVTVSENIQSDNISGNIYMQDSYTRDKNILWKSFNLDETYFDYDWNEYLVITDKIYFH